MLKTIPLLFALVLLATFANAQKKSPKPGHHPLTKPANVTTLPNGLVMYTGRDLMYSNGDLTVRSANIILPRLKLHLDKNGVPLPNDPDNPVMFVNITSFPSVGAGTVYSLYAVTWDNNTWATQTQLAISAQARQVGNNFAYYVDFMIMGKPDVAAASKK